MIALRLDERGVLCPLPVIHLAQRICDVDVGEEVEVLCDDPAAATDIPAWCAMRRQVFVRAEPRAAPPADASDAPPADARGDHTAYLIRRAR